MEKLKQNIKRLLEGQVELYKYMRELNQFKPSPLSHQT